MKTLMENECYLLKISVTYGKQGKQVALRENKCKFRAFLWKIRIPAAIFAEYTAISFLADVVEQRLMA